MTSTYSVGSIIGADDLDALPTGTKLEFTAGGMRVTELPPQVSERDQLAVELWNAMCPETAREHVSDFSSSDARVGSQRLADYVLDNFTRNGAHSPDAPDTVTDDDDDGDTWYLMDNGNYTMSVNRTAAYGGRSLDELREVFGPLKGASPALEVLIDRDGDRWEQQENGKFRMRASDTLELCEDERTRDWLDRTYYPLRAA